ncbi:hypothetical protein R3P38DRAFT_2413192, partial [Favolaschia claudopus]
FAAKTMIGCLPPKEGLRLYMARIDPHLTSGCEVCLDTSNAHLEILTSVQHEFLRRLLGVHGRSILAVLFTETGIIPLNYRRVTEVLGYLGYVLGLSPSHIAGDTYLDSLALAGGGFSGWVSDLKIVMESLPVAVELRASDLCETAVPDLCKRLEVACERWLNAEMQKMSSRLPLLQHRLDLNSNSLFVHKAMKFRLYLNVPIPAHRKALTRLMLSSHTLSVEILRYKERWKLRVPRDCRLCRFCRLGVENEWHATIEC